MWGADWPEMVGLRPGRLVPPYTLRIPTYQTKAIPTAPPVLLLEPVPKVAPPFSPTMAVEEPSFLTSPDDTRTNCLLPSVGSTNCTSPLIWSGLAPRWFDADASDGGHSGSCINTVTRGAPLSTLARVASSACRCAASTAANDASTALRVCHAIHTVAATSRPVRIARARVILEGYDPSEDTIDDLFRLGHGDRRSAEPATSLRQVRRVLGGEAIGCEVLLDTMSDGWAPKPLMNDRSGQERSVCTRSEL